MEGLFFAQADGQTCSSLAGNRKLDEKPKVCGVSDFIYIEHNVYAILILEVPELAVISQTQSVYAEI